MQNNIENVKKFSQQAESIRAELRRDVVGQTEVVENVIIAIVAGGNVLLEGVPGVGKTRLVRSLGRILNLPFSRIQFTPDLMPSDVTGMNVIEKDESGKMNQVLQGSNLCKSCTGRRDQPCHSQDPVSNAGGYAGA